MASDIVGAVGDVGDIEKAPRTAVWYSIIRTTFFVPDRGKGIEQK